jgi:hypothetical protein
LEAAMPLTREQRNRLVSALRWSRKNGWKAGVWPRTWNSATHWVGYDSETSILFVDSAITDSLDLRARRAKVRIHSVDQALDILAALGLLHPGLSPLVSQFAIDTIDPAGQPDPTEFDGPASFGQAGQAFADLVHGRVTPLRAAEALSTLARQGLIASIEYLEETASGQVATDLTLHALGHETVNLADLAMVMSSGHYVPLDQELP